MSPGIYGTPSRTECFLSHSVRRYRAGARQGQACVRGRHPASKSGAGSVALPSTPPRARECSTSSGTPARACDGRPASRSSACRGGSGSTPKVALDHYAHFMPGAGGRCLAAMDAWLEGRHRPKVPDKSLVTDRIRKIPVEPAGQGHGRAGCPHVGEVQGDGAGRARGRHRRMLTARRWTTGANQ